MSYGVVTEQGDLGLGFNEMTEEEEAQVKKQQQENQQQTPEQRTGKDYD